MATFNKNDNLVHPTIEENDLLREVSVSSVEIDTGDKQSLIERCKEDDNNHGKKSEFETIPLSTPDTDEPSGIQETVTVGDENWLATVWQFLVALGAGTLSVIDYLGERLAWFFGITTPKYQYVLNEIERLKRMEEEERLQELREKQEELLAVAVDANDTLQLGVERPETKDNVADADPKA